MKTNLSLHLFNTWLITHLLHPVAILLWINLRKTGLDGGDEWAIVWFIFMFGVVFSLPGLLVARIGLWLVVRLRLSTPELSMATWLVTGALSVMSCGLAFILYFRAFDWSVFSILIPALAAFIGAALIRYKQFVQLFHSWQESTDADQETQTY